MATARGCIAGACAYGAWVALTDSAKRQIDHWGPDWVVRLLPLGGAAVMNALGVRWAHALDDAAGVAAVRAGRAGGIGAVSPHGPYATCAILFGMPFFRLEETRRGIRSVRVFARVVVINRAVFLGCYVVSGREIRDARRGVASVVLRLAEDVARRSVAR